MWFASLFYWRFSSKGDFTFKNYIVMVPLLQDYGMKIKR